MRACVLAVALGLGVAVPAHAATFTVTNLANSGAGSLRQAIADANAAPGADTITFAVTGTINLDNTAGTIGISEALTIAGPGSAQLVLDAGGTNRFFSIVESGAPACPALSGPADYLVTISGLTFRNGQRNVANSVGGAIISLKSLALDDVVFENNRARGGGAVWLAVQHPGQSLTVQNARFTGNAAREIVAGTTSTYAGGAIGVAENCAGTRTQPVTVDIADSVFRGNVAETGVVNVNARGGAIFFNGDVDVTVLRSTLDGNKARQSVVNPAVNAQGGAISGGAQTLSIRDSTISGNEAQRSSALHLFNDAVVRQTFQERMRVNVTNSTISDNRAYETTTVLGFANIQLGFYNSVVVGNRTDQNRTSGINLFTGPTVPASASNATPPTLQLESSVLWNPLGVRDIGKDVSTMPGALAITSNNSIVGRLCNADCGPGPMTLVGAGNQVGVDPLLGALADNGGPTQTRLPQLGSPVVNAGNNALALATEQRGAGFPRVVGSAADMGATEYVPPLNCEGFTDVAGSSGFCASVSYIRNRSITQGCTATEYCPNNLVSRLQMAAFMQRIGQPLSGTVQMTAAAPGIVDFAASPSPVVCASDPVAASTAPRRAVLEGVFSGLAGADSFGRLRLVVSEDGGTTWEGLQIYYPRATYRANQWRNVRIAAQHDIGAGKTARYGLRLDSGSPPAVAGVLDSTCRLRVRIDNSAGFTPVQ